MKKLDKLIIKAFVGPFVATFFITLFVLIMQFFWLWIDDFVGKGLDAATILKFIWYQSAVLIPLALPLSILLSSLMTFGNLGESFELVAIKSAGISLLRFMRPLFVVATIIAFCAFLFSNYVIPVANLKSRTLLADIVLAKPAFAIKEGVFFDGIDKFAIKIGKKESNDSIIRDIIVYQNDGSGLQDAFLIARDGVMKPSPDKQFLDIVFKNGWRYEERGNKGDSITDFIRMGFKEYKMQMDISSFSFKDKTKDSSNINEKMYNMRQLNVAIDSIALFNQEVARNFESSLYSPLSILNYRDSVAKGMKPADSILNFAANIKAYMVVKKDSTQLAADSVRKADSLKLKRKNDSLSLMAITDSAIRKTKLDSFRQQTRKDSIQEKNRQDSIQRRMKKDSIRKKNKIDSIRQQERKDSLKAARLLSRDKTTVATANSTEPQDTGSRKDLNKLRPDSAENARTDSLRQDSIRKDSIRKIAAAKARKKRNPNDFDALIPDSARQQVQDRALSVLNSMKSNLEMNAGNIVEQEKTLQKYKIEWHDKITLALACLVLFMIGAPLGSIIRKGGLGMPMIFAIIFFMIFYFVRTRGQKLAKELELSAFAGMWLAVFVLLPIGIFLIYKAMHDSNLFNKEFYTRLKRKILKKIGKA